MSESQYLETPTSYLQNEAWYEVTRGDEIKMSGRLASKRPYILIINSYGRLRKLYTDSGSYVDLSNGGPESARPNTTNTGDE